MKSLVTGLSESIFPHVEQSKVAWPYVINNGTIFPFDTAFAEEPDP